MLVIICLCFTLLFIKNCSCQKTWPDIDHDPLLFIANPIEAEMPGHWIPQSIVKEMLQLTSPRPPISWNTLQPHNSGTPEVEELLDEDTLPPPKPKRKPKPKPKPKPVKKPETSPNPPSPTKPVPSPHPPPPPPTNKPKPPPTEPKPPPTTPEPSHPPPAAETTKYLPKRKKKKEKDDTHDNGQ